MGNVMENRFLRSFTSKAKYEEVDVAVHPQTEVLCSSNIFGEFRCLLGVPRICTFQESTSLKKLQLW